MDFCGLKPEKKTFQKKRNFKQKMKQLSLSDIEAAVVFLEEAHLDLEIKNPNVLPPLRANPKLQCLHELLVSAYLFKNHSCLLTLNKLKIKSQLVSLLMSHYENHYEKKKEQYIINRSLKFAKNFAKKKHQI